MSSDHREDLEVALAAARAGATELRRWYRPSGVREAASSKTERRNLVTGADTASEEAVIALLARERPADGVLAEESAPDAGAGSGR